MEGSGRSGPCSSRRDGSRACPARHPVRLLRPRVPHASGPTRPSRRSPSGSSTRRATSSTRQRTSTRGQKVFLGNGLMEYGSVFGHGAYLGPDYTADYLRRASNIVKRSYGGARSDRAAQRTIEDFRTNRYDEGTGHAHADRRAGRGPPPAGAPLQPLLLRAHHQARAAPQRDHRPQEARPADRVLRLDGVGRRRRAPRPQLLVHEQLAARAAGGQQADGERDRLERALADRAARRHRDPLRGLRSLGLPRLARARAGHP